MASVVEGVNSPFAINQFFQSKSITNGVVTGEFSNMVSNVSSVNMELDGLQNDLSELIHILHVAERSSVKEIIQADIHLILSKIENLEVLSKNQLETHISWSRVAALKHNKSKYKEQKTTDPLYLNSNRYDLLKNDVVLENNTLSMAVSVSVKKPTVTRVRKLKTNNRKKKQAIRSVHKVLITGDSHARECAADVKGRLNRMR
jgi:uncharacterized protein (UPF0335 family)